MKEVFFNPNFTNLLVKIDYQLSPGASPDLGAVYTYKLWEANSGALADLQTGNNLNDDDDLYALPTPLSKNNERIVDVLSTLSNFGSTTIDMRVRIQFFQEGTLIDEHIVEKIIPPNTTIPTESFIRLKSN
jgi:hypothetical protein